MKGMCDILKFPEKDNFGNTTTNSATLRRCKTDFLKLMMLMEITRDQFHTNNCIKLTLRHKFCMLFLTYSSKFLKHIYLQVIDDSYY